MTNELSYLLYFQEQLANAIDACKHDEQPGLILALEMLEDLLREVNDG